MERGLYTYHELTKIDYEGFGHPVVPAHWRLLATFFPQGFNLHVAPKLESTESGCFDGKIL